MGAVTNGRPLLWALAALLVATCTPVEGARILGVFGHIGKSHWDVFKPLMMELAKRGHQVVVIGYFPLSEPIANYTDISIEGTISDFSPVGQIDVTEMKINNWLDIWKEHHMLSSLAIGGCEASLGHPKVQKMLQSNQKFDLLITETFNSDCYLAFAHHYKIPYITMSSCVLMPWSYERYGYTLNTAYIPDIFQDNGVQMNFWERIENTFNIVIENIIYEFLYHRPTEKIARKYFKDLPPLDEMIYNTSMMFVNTHFSMVRARPQPPAVVEVAGIHLPKRNPLPKDIQEFLDGGKDGVVYFNMGSMIRATSLAPATRQAFLEAFTRLGKRVIWKWEEDTMPGQPPSVKTSKWLPQYDVLSHPNVRLYVGHGGMLGSIEAAYASVPMVVIPIFGDQRVNSRNLEQSGMALRLDYEDVTADSVLTALKEVLENPKYLEATRKISRSLRDRPQTPLDAAVYWTEYVIRHEGAPQLRSVTLDLRWYQRWLLDVAAVAFATLALFLLVLRIVASRLFSSSRAVRKLKGE